MPGGCAFLVLDFIKQNFRRPFADLIIGVNHGGQGHIHPRRKFEIIIFNIIYNSGERPFGKKIEL